VHLLADETEAVWCVDITELAADARSDTVDGEDISKDVDLNLVWKVEERRGHFGGASLGADAAVAGRSRRMGNVFEDRAKTS
jgi:hypothetical protein